MNSSLIVEGNNLDTSMANMIQERLKLERVLRDRIERQGDPGRSIRLETLRREVQYIFMRQIKSLEAVEKGVAQF